MNRIFSKDHAEKVGRKLTGGEPGEVFTVFTYPHKPSNLTAFGIEINATKQIVTVE